VQRSVFEYEPRMAVFAGDNGLDVIRPLVKQSYTVLKSGGYLAMEIGFSMREVVVELLSHVRWEEPTVVPDLQGIPRVITAKKR
jgi:release factor glutamine methyltransferase